MRERQVVVPWACKLITTRLMFAPVCASYSQIDYLVRKFRKENFTVHTGVVTSLYKQLR